MFKKAVLMVLAAMLIVFGATASYAYQTNGMASAAGPALPVGLTGFVNPDGLGDALIYGYFNVRGNLNLFNIVNTSSGDGVKVRVIFKEAIDSTEILDFSVCLSKGDVWTAYLADDGTAGHIYGGVDTDTITAPAITSAGQQFKFSGIPHIDGTALTANDTKEGYFEVVSFSPIPGYDKNASSTASCTNSTWGGSYNCIRSAQNCADWCSTGSPCSLSYPPTNVILGTNAIFEVASLGTYEYNATAFADAIQSIVSDPGPGVYVSLVNGTGFTCNALDWILNKYQLISPYDILASIGGETELITTFPSRLDCHPDTTVTTVYGGGTLDAYFNCTAHSIASTPTICTAYCTVIGINIWDDKEHLQSVLDFSPAVGSCLPHEVNVIKLGGSNIWNSGVPLGVSMGTYELGWINIGLGGGNHTMAYGGRTNSGLPVIAYTTQSFVGGYASYMAPAFHTTYIQ